MEQVWQAELEFRGHEGPIVAISCMGDGGLCTGSHDGSVRFGAQAGGEADWYGVKDLGSRER